jgi:hypothetical protein
MVADEDKEKARFGERASLKFSFRLRPSRVRKRPPYEPMPGIYPANGFRRKCEMHLHRKEEDAAAFETGTEGLRHERKRTN